jgi:hypothetical protein
MVWQHDSVLYHLAWSIVAGISAGATFFVGYYWREKRHTEAIRRVERFQEWVIRTVLRIAEVHNEYHPEAKVDTGGLSKLLYDASSHPFRSEDPSP